MGIFSFLSGPLGWIMKLVYGLVNNYFVAIFLFTLLMRAVLFPLSLQSQKKQADRIRLAPRLERLQKKYKNDPQKLQEKQQALYQKEGVSLTGGCAPMLIQMVILFGIIGVIYQPLQYLSSVDSKAIDAAVKAVNVETYKVDGVFQSEYTLKDGTVITVNESDKVAADRLTGYYEELNMMNAIGAGQNKDDILAMIRSECDMSTAEAQEQLDAMVEMRNQFSFGDHSLLEEPWNDKGFGGITILWLIPLISGLTAVLSSVLSMHFSKQGMSGEKQPGQGCTNASMMLFMPLFSLYISFRVPGGVGVYWICSNIIAIIQTVILNMIYNPKKIREQAEIDYQERRRRRAEEKKRTLADARRLADEQERLEDEAAAKKAAEEQAQPKDKKSAKKAKKDLGLEMGELKTDANETENTAE